MPAANGRPRLSFLMAGSPKHLVGGQAGVMWRPREDSNLQPTAYKAGMCGFARIPEIRYEKRPDCHSQTAGSSGATYR